MSGGASALLHGATFVAAHSQRTVFCCFVFWTPLKSEEGFEPQDVKDKMHFAPLRILSVLTTDTRTQHPNQEGYSASLREGFLWTGCCSQTIVQNRETGKQDQPSRKPRGDELGVRRGKTANIWKSFQWGRKEAKQRGHYCNFLVFSLKRCPGNTSC